MYFKSKNKFYLNLYLPKKIIFLLAKFITKEQIFRNTSFKKNNPLIKLCNKNLNDYFDNI